MELLFLRFFNFLFWKKDFSKYYKHLGSIAKIKKSNNVKLF